MDFKKNNINKISEREKEVLKIYKNFNMKNKHKMKNIPIFKKKYDF